MVMLSTFSMLWNFKMKAIFMYIFYIWSCFGISSLIRMVGIAYVTLASRFLSSFFIKKYESRSKDLVIGYEVGLRCSQEIKMWPPLWWSSSVCIKKASLLQRSLVVGGSSLACAAVIKQRGFYSTNEGFWMVGAKLGIVFKHNRNGRS